MCCEGRGCLSPRSTSLWSPFGNGHSQKKNTALHCVSLLLIPSTQGSGHLSVDFSRSKLWSEELRVHSLPGEAGQEAPLGVQGVGRQAGKADTGCPDERVTTAHSILRSQQSGRSCLRVVPAQWWESWAAGGGLEDSHPGV